MVQKEKSETKHKKDYHKILQTITADLLQKRLYTDPTSLLLIDCRHPELFEKSNIITSLNVHITKHNKGITPQQIEDEFTRYEYKIFFRQREFLHIVMYEQSVPQGRTIPKSSSAYRLYKILRQEGLAKEIFILKGGFDEFVKKFGSFCNGKNDLVISSPLTENQEECTTAKCKKKCNQVAQLIPTITQQIIDLKYSKAHTITLEERIQIAHKKLFSSFKTNLTCELPSMIFEHLYLGNIHNSVNYAQLNQLGIKYILNCAKECKNKFRDSLTYLKCSLIDEETADIAQYFDQCFQFIELARSEYSRVLVHCFMGMSRSAAIVVAYVMRYKQWPLKKAYKYVKSKRAIVEINMGFLCQLIDYEQQLFGATSIPKSMIKR